MMTPSLHRSVRGKPRTNHRTLRYSIAIALSAFVAVPGFAQETSEGPLLEYPRGPIVTSNRVIGMGGAFTGVSEGAAGHNFNPASYATRYPYSAGNDLDWDYSFYVLELAGDQNPDLHGPPGQLAESGYFGGGLDLKIHGFGIGFQLHQTNYVFDVTEDPAIALEGRDFVDVSNTSLSLGVGFGVHELDMLFGATAMVYGWSLREGLDPAPDAPALAQLTGGGGQLGMLWRPHGLPVRAGLAYRPRLQTNTATYSDDELLEARPQGVFLPPQLTVGASLMLWERVYNPYLTWGLERFEELEHETDDLTKRRYVLLSVDVVQTGPSPPGTVTMRSFFDDVTVPVGTASTVGVRAGIESEVIANWLVLRSGSYFEPTRVDPAIARSRIHGTAGFALRVPFWPIDLRVDFAADIARDYASWGFGAGFWH